MGEDIRGHQRSQSHPGAPKRVLMNSAGQECLGSSPTPQSSDHGRKAVVLRNPLGSCCESLRPGCYCLQSKGPLLSWVLQLPLALSLASSLWEPLGEGHPGRGALLLLCKVDRTLKEGKWCRFHKRPAGAREKPTNRRILPSVCCSQCRPYPLGLCEPSSHFRSELALILYPSSHLPTLLLFF